MTHPNDGCERARIWANCIIRISGKEASLGAAKVFAEDVAAKREVIKSAGGQFVELPAASIAEMQVAADATAQSWITSNTKDGFDAAAYLNDAKTFAAQFGG